MTLLGLYPELAFPLIICILVIIALSVWLIKWFRGRE